MVSTVAEIKRAVTKLAPRKKVALAKWLQSQVRDGFTDEEMMAIAAEGARVLVGNRWSDWHGNFH